MTYKFQGNKGSEIILLPSLFVVNLNLFKTKKMHWSYISKSYFILLCLILLCRYFNVAEI